ncbi:regulatory protein RecX [Xylanibacter oryzae]|uniref:regulatory protein RecX n=1 Tax=Xylanibacter oryzae TaxID=185293 RepID=UPI0004B5531B|nr:regulatory protein RecX [Xylanibacter oryzae]
MKEISEKDALFRLSALCSSAEHCSYEMIQKMQKWGLSEEVQDRIMRKLTEEKFIDDERFCRFFVKDKIRYSKWGRRKIEQALWAKRIPASIQQDVLDNVEKEEYLNILRPLLKKKRKSTKATNDYELNGKLIRFALSKGFGMDIIRECIDNADEFNIDEDEN